MDSLATLELPAIGYGIRHDFGIFEQLIDRQAIEEIFSLSLIKTGHNVVLVGPNGIGKTVILKNVAHHALSCGHTARVVTASDMLAELAGQDTSPGLARRMRRYTVPQLLCVDEVGISVPQ